MPRKIDLLITGLDFGGAEMQVVSLLLNIDRTRFQPRLITLLPPVALVDRLAAEGIPVLSLGMRRKWQAPLALWRLVALLRANGTELVHAHMVHANFMARLARLFLPRVKVISSAHNIAEGGRLREQVYAWTDWLSDVNTNVSASAVQRYIRVGASPARKMRLFYNGIDVNRFRPAEPAARPHTRSCFRWIAVGRLEEQKDYPGLLKAIALLRAMEAPPFCLDIVGKGYLEQELKVQAEHLGLAGQVAFLGVREDVELLYRKADGFVLSSAYEGYGLVVAEAMASGLPVVVTDSGGPPEIVGALGQVVPPENAAALAEAMLSVMRQPEGELARLGVEGRARICEQFSLGAAVIRWQDLYDELLSGRQPA